MDERSDERERSLPGFGPPTAANDGCRGFPRQTVLPQPGKAALTAEVYADGVTSPIAMQMIERLTREGVISPPQSTARTKMTGRARIRPKGSVSDLVAEQRR
jgi:hypothetical protein